MRYQRLRAKIVEAGYNLRRLAKAMNIDKNTFSRKMNGQTQFKLNEVQNLCILLRLTDPIEICDIFLPMASQIRNE